MFIAGLRSGQVYDPYISNSMVNWKKFGRDNIRRGIWQEDSLSSFFSIVMLPLTIVLRKMRAAGYKLAKT